MAQGTTTVLGRIALRRVRACAVPSPARTTPAVALDGASRPAMAEDDAGPGRDVLQAVLAYLAGA